MASATGNVAEAVLPPMQRPAASLSKAMRSKFVCDVCREGRFPTQELAMEHERTCRGGGVLGVMSRNGPGGPAPEEAAGIPTWDAVADAPRSLALQNAPSPPKLAVDTDPNNAIAAISKGPPTTSRPEAIIILDVTPPIPKITPKSALLQTVSKTKHRRKETKKRKRDDHRARMQRQLELMACRGEHHPAPVGERGSPLSGSSSMLSSSPVGGNEGGVVDLCGSGASDGSEAAAGSGSSANDRTGQTVEAETVSQNGREGAFKKEAQRSDVPIDPAAGKASPPAKREGTAQDHPRVVHGKNHANNGSPFAKRRVAPGSVASRALAALEDDSSEEECSGGEGDDDNLGREGDDDPSSPLSVATEGVVGAKSGDLAPCTARASATTSSIMRSFRERRLELLERRLRKHYRRKRQRERGRDGAAGSVVDGSRSNAGSAPGDAISVESIGPTSNDIVWIDSDTSDGAEGGNRTSSVPPEQSPRERKCPSQCTPGPKYPSGCPVWFNMQYSKPCSTYLMSDKGVVRSALWDRRTGRFVYTVERNREVISVAEDDLAFAVHCPVSLKKEGGEISEMAGEVIHVKPIAGNDGHVTRLYTVMLTMDDGAVKVEEGVVPDRLRYRCRLTTLQSKIRDTAPAFRSQKGFGIRSNKEGEPMQNKKRPVVRMRRRCPSPIASAEDSASSEDDSSATEAEEEEDLSRPLSKRQKQTRDSVDSALHSLRPTARKRRKKGGSYIRTEWRKSVSYTGAYWKKRDNHYEASLYFSSKVKHISLGTFQHMAEAALAHDVGARLLKKTKCNFNFPSRQAYNLALQAEMESKGQIVDVDASYSAVLAKAKERVAKWGGRDIAEAAISAFSEYKENAGDDQSINNDVGERVSSGEKADQKNTADAETNAGIDDRCNASEDEEEEGSLKHSMERQNEASGSHRDSYSLLPMESESEKKKTSSYTGVSGAQKTSKSGYRGVAWREREKRYEARLWLDSKLHSMGYYKYKADAALAHDAGAKVLKSDGHKLNFSSKQAYDLAVRAETESKGQIVDVDASYSTVLDKAKGRVAKWGVSGDEATTMPPSFYECNGSAGGVQSISKAEGELISAGEKVDQKNTAGAEMNASIDDKCSAVEAEEEGGSLRRSNERWNEASGSRHPSSPLLPMESESEKKKTSCCTGVSGAQKKSKSGYRGVTWRERAKRYDARVWFNSKIHSMGYYKYKADAALAYDAATKMVKGDSRRLNFSSKQAYKLAIKAEMESKGRSVDVDASYSAVLAKVKAKMEKLLIFENEKITSSVKNDVGRDMGGREKDRQAKSADNGGVNDHAALPGPPKNQFKEADTALDVPSATVPLSSESLAELDDSPMHALATAMRTMSRGRGSNDAKKEMAAATSDGASDDSDEEEDGVETNSPNEEKTAHEENRSCNQTTEGPL